MIQLEADSVGARIRVSGAMRMCEAAEFLAKGEEALAAIPRGKRAVFDLGAVSEMDSSCLAVVFGWMRCARAAEVSLRLINPPKSLMSLAAVYGVGDLLPQL